MALIDAISHLLGQKTTRRFETGGKVTTHAPLTDSQQAVSNAQMAADGARMFQAAHPGVTYAPGQNGETYRGGIDSSTYAQLLLRPAPRPAPVIDAQTIQARHGRPQPSITLPGGNRFVNIQGGPLPMQPQRHQLNPQSQTLYYTGDY